MRPWIVAVALTGAVVVSFAVPRPDDADPELGSVACARARIAAELDAAAQDSARALAADLLQETTDVLHYHLELEVVPTEGRVAGTNRISAVSQVDGLATFRLRLHQQLDIGDVTVDGQPATAVRLDSATVEIVLPRAVRAGERFEVRVPYAGYPPHDGSAVMFRSRSGRPEAATLSQPWYAYLWWPVKDDSRDKATVEVELIVPAGLQGVSNGRLVDVDTLGAGRRVYHWRTDYATAPYLVFFAVTEFNTFVDSFSWNDATMPLEFFIYPELDTSANRARWLQTRDMLAAFSARFGAYPFFAEKYGIYQFPYNGGMEHQTCSGQGGFWESLTAHELAHQWWGDLVTCASWSDIWLNEGFATYAEALWEEAKAGPDDGAAALAAAMAARRPANPRGSVYIPEPTSVSRIFSHDLSYLKGAWVLHMLRGVLGDEAFFSALTAYRQRFAFGAASTEDFRTVAESVAGSSLEWFFAQWVYGYGVPSFSVGSQEVVVGGQRYLELAVGQEQGAGLPPFRVPLRLALGMPGQSASAEVWNWAYRQHYLIPVDGPVDYVELDPGGWVLDSGRRTVPFVPGPPKLVGLACEGGGEPAAGSPATFLVTFHEPVAARAEDFSLVGELSGAVPLRLTTEAAGNVVRLTTASPLQRDAYTLTVADSITDHASGQPLDGELGAGAQAILPSGDGLPGGAAIYRFAARAVPRLRVRAGG